MPFQASRMADAMFMCLLRRTETAIHGEESKDVSETSFLGLARKRVTPNCKTKCTKMRHKTKRVQRREKVTSSLYLA